MRKAIRQAEGKQNPNPRRSDRRPKGSDDHFKGGGRNYTWT